MKIAVRTLLAAAALATIVRLPAQEAKRTLSLDEAIAVALTENPAMKAIRRGSVGEVKVTLVSRNRSHHSLAATYKNAAMQLPEMEPMPPMTTINRIS